MNTAVSHQRNALLYRAEVTPWIMGMLMDVVRRMHPSVTMTICCTCRCAALWRTRLVIDEFLPTKPHSLSFLWCAANQCFPVPSYNIHLPNAKSQKIIDQCESQRALGPLPKVLADEWTLVFSRNSWRIHQMRLADKYHMNSWWPWFVWRSRKGFSKPQNTGRRGQTSRPAALVQPLPHCPQRLHNCPKHRQLPAAKVRCFEQQQQKNVI